MKYIIFCFFLLLAIPMTGQGPLDGYMKGKGALDLAPSYSFMRAADFAGADGRIYDESYRGNLLSLFAEYGVTKNFDLVATLPYIFTSTQRGLQDGGIYAKYRPFYKYSNKTGGLGLIVGLGASFPLSDYEPVAAGALGQRAVATPARLIFQWDTPAGLFVNLTGGYTWRLDRLKEEDIATIRLERPAYDPPEPRPYTTALLKVGYPAARFYADAWVEWQYTKGGADYAPRVVDLPQAYGVSYVQAGGTLYYSEKGNQGAYISGGYILSGRNVSRVLRFTVGMVFKFKT